MSVRLRNTANNMLVDDTQSRRVDGQGNKSLQEIVEALDKAQDKDDDTVFRPERVLGTISSLLPPREDGWYLSRGAIAPLDIENNNLILLSSGVIKDRYVPKLGDTIKLDKNLLNFTGAEWVDLSIKHFYRINSETLNGDRILTNDDFEIQDYTSEVTTTLTITLPTDPSTHRFFAFINDISSQGNLLIDGVTISPGERYEIIFNGTKWKIL